MEKHKNTDPKLFPLLASLSSFLRKRQLKDDDDDANPLQTDID